MNQKVDTDILDVEKSVNTTIRETERYYREQIFSSGCSSLVPIYRISENTCKTELLLKQLAGSPYIQMNVVFSEKIIETLLDVTLYRYNDYHFFFQGDMRKELQDFIEKECEETSSFSRLLQHQPSTEYPTWRTLQSNIDLILQDYPFLSEMPIDEHIKQIQSTIKNLNFHPTLSSYLNLFYRADWHDKIRMNQASLLCMIAMASKLGWKTLQIKSLVMLGLLKDIGYTRLSEHIDNFEVLHPLVGHKIILDSNTMSSSENSIPPDVINAILMHHEFTDGSGPLGRMRHPQIMQRLGSRMPDIAQISGICDLFIGFLKYYSPGLAFSITCGFVLGQGKVEPRYSTPIINAFSEVIRDAAYQ
ncbi:MAG: hypothetical protein P8176_15965, partial [Gammaproteobacteria bacterium]